MVGSMDRVLVDKVDWKDMVGDSNDMEADRDHSKKVDKGMPLYVYKGLKEDKEMYLWLEVDMV